MQRAELPSLVEAINDKEASPIMMYMSRCETIQSFQVLTLLVRE